MLSLYFHIPFCAKNCPYCSFSVVQEPNEKMISDYLKFLHNEIDEWGKVFEKAEIKSIYFGGGTPNLVGADEIIKLVHHCEETFDCENMGELSFECNPFPQDSIYEFISSLQKEFKKYPRVRFSFGIQSLDNGVLENAGRPYTFPGMVDFLRGLRDLKQETTVFNFDFMAFGVFNQTKKGDLQLWTPNALEFFSDFVNSGFADSFSLYMLELFEHQKRKKTDPYAPSMVFDQRDNKLFGDEDEIYEEFDFLKNIIQEGGYKRYEISNFSSVGKSSIHNRVYWEMENYLGLGLSASSFIRGDCQYFQGVVEKLGIKNDKLSGVRWTNTPYFPKYLQGERIPKSSIQLMSQSDFLIESFFLALRTDRGISDIEKFQSVLVDDYQEKLQLYEENGYLVMRDEGFVLTDEGMDCYNTIITELLKEI